MNWITLDELILIHGRVIEQTGGAHGVTHLGSLESVLARPFTSFSGVELFPDNISKVAALIHAIIAFHPFVDGNKRTALVACDICLRLNGLQLIPSEAVEPFFWAIARGEKDVEAISHWLSKHFEIVPEEQ